MFAEPVATGTIRPVELTLATAELLLLHKQEFVMFCVDDPEYIPVAVTWRLDPPTVIAGFVGVTAIDWSMLNVVSETASVRVTVPSVATMVST